MVQSEPLLIDPDYQNFEPGRSRLKPRTFSPEHDAAPLAGCIGILFFVIGALTMIGGFALILWISLRFDQEGMLTQAVIESCQVRTARNGNTSAHIVYEYVIEGEVYYQQTDPGSAECSAFPEGTLINLQYLPDNPHQARLADENPLPLLAALGFGGLASIGFTGYFVWLMRNYAQAQAKRRHLSIHGQLLPGRITRFEPAAPRSFGSDARSAHLEYQFTDPAGQPREGQMKIYSALNPVQLRQLHRGVLVTVLYADENTHVVL